MTTRRKPQKTVRKEDFNMGNKLFGLIAGAVIIFIGIILMVANMTTVGADEIVVKQNALDGQLQVWSSPGLHWTAFGTVTRYKRSAQYWFSADKVEGKAEDESIKVRFNDGGHGNVSGSLRYDLPTDYTHMVKLHSVYGGMPAIDHQLVRQVVNKCVYMSGPLMSSKESYAERRSDLINTITDQVSHGIYKTETQDVKIKDIISGQEKTASMVRPIRGDAPNGILRQEASPLDEFGIRAYNLTINGITYASDVEAQIKQQQDAAMSVQTAMAEARKAEQKAITVEKEGQAKAAEAKWAQEVEKAKAVTKAQQEVEVARLDLESAKLNKETEITTGQGEAERRRLAMSADGALEKKLAAWVEVNKAYADALSKKPVPQVVMGQSGHSDTDFMNMLQVQTAKQLMVNPAPAAGK